MKRTPKTGWAQASAGKLLTAQSKLFTALGDRGVEVVQRLDSDLAYREWVAEQMLHGCGFPRGVSRSIHHSRAREIMGKQHFWGIEEWRKMHGLPTHFSDEQLCQIVEFPWDEEILNEPCPFENTGFFGRMKRRRIKDTHFAYLGVDRISHEPLTVVIWEELLAGFTFRKEPKISISNTIDINEVSTKKTTCQLRWHLVPIKGVLDETGKDYFEQWALLPESYEVPSAVEEVTKILLYQWLNAVWINSGRCRDAGLYMNGAVVRLRFPSDVGVNEVHVDTVCRLGNYTTIGLAASRIPGR